MRARRCRRGWSSRSATRRRAARPCPAGRGTAAPGRTACGVSAHAPATQAAKEQAAAELARLRQALGEGRDAAAQADVLQGQVAALMRCAARLVRGAELWR